MSINTTLNISSKRLKLCLVLLLLVSMSAAAQDDGSDPNAPSPVPEDSAPQDDTDDTSESTDPFADEVPSEDPFTDDAPATDVPEDNVPEDNVPEDGIGDLPEGVPLPEDIPEDGIGDLPEGVPLPDYLQEEPAQQDPALQEPAQQDSVQQPVPAPDAPPPPPADEPLPDGTTFEEFEGVPLPEGFEEPPQPLPPVDAPPVDAPPDGTAPPSDDVPPASPPPPDGTPAPDAAPVQEVPPIPGATPPADTAPVDPASTPDAAPVPSEPAEVPVPSGPSLSLGQVLALSAQQTRVTTAQLELEEARQNLERRRADPLGLRVPLLQAEQRVQAAETRYLNAYYDSARELVAAYTGLQLARQEQARAAEALALSETLQQAAVIRQNNGSATALDVQEAQNRLELAQNELTQSQDALALAEARLRSLVNSEVGPLEDLPQSAFDTELPPADVVSNSGEQNPELLSALQSSDLAEATLNTLDPLYTAPAQLESAQVEALSAQEALTRAQSDFQLTIQGLYDEALSAQSACALRQISRDNAVERLELERARVESGLLSELELRQLELDTLDAELDTFRVCRNYLAALLELQANSGLGSSLISAPQQ